MAGKYSGPFIPGAGGDDLPPAPKPSLREKYGEGGSWQIERALNKQRLAIWMNGREPEKGWEHFPPCERWPYPLTVLWMEFPETVHYFVIAYEKRPEYGRLYTWCFGCKCDDCGACSWIRNEYVATLREQKRIGRVAADDVPF